MRTLKKNKSPGSDGIAAEMLQAGGEALARQIHELCNRACANTKEIRSKRMRELPNDLPHQPHRKSTAKRATAQIQATTEAPSV
ncbi:unnamed protein product [Rotaria socialis]|uniref:Uncharacterized protein n=1 Tax=Rotaria socialis TaxID=392032 RepID=A0A821H9X7_9BILA|nr:unnamed protein product [Rotaria socialis]CAF5010357.1 unnamed protein product [Rotaria socialis]